jgi:hypothetical protein
METVFIPSRDDPGARGVHSNRRDREALKSFRKIIPARFESSSASLCVRENRIQASAFVKTSPFLVTAAACGDLGPAAWCSSVRSPRKGIYFSSSYESSSEVDMPKTERDREISRRRQRRLKMEFLKKRLADAKDSKARAAIAQKILKLNPQANVSPK